MSGLRTRRVFGLHATDSTRWRADRLRLPRVGFGASGSSPATAVTGLPRLPPSSKSCKGVGESTQSATLLGRCQGRSSTPRNPLPLTAPAAAYRTRRRIARSWEPFSRWWRPSLRTADVGIGAFLGRRRLAWQAPRIMRSASSQNASLDPERKRFAHNASKKHETYARNPSRSKPLERSREALLPTLLPTTNSCGYRSKQLCYRLCYRLRNFCYRLSDRLTDFLTDFLTD